MGRYVLCRYALGQSGQVEIPETDYFGLAADIKTLVEVSDVEEKFNAFIDNYFELERGLLEETLRSMIYNEHGPDRFLGSKNTISRRVINLLTAIKLYLDSLPQHANRLLTGEGLENLKASPSRAYDRSLSYRTIEALRNYAQHVAFPVHRWMVEQSWDDSTDPSLDIEKLAAADKFKKSVLEELQKKAGPVQLKPLIREYIEQLGIVHAEFRKATKSLVDEATKRIKAAVARFVEQHPGSEISVVALPVDEEGLKAGDPVYLSATVMKYLPHLQARVGSLVNFSRRRVEY